MKQMSFVQYNCHAFFFHSLHQSLSKRLYQEENIRPNDQTVERNIDSNMRDGIDFDPKTQQSF